MKRTMKLAYLVALIFMIVSSAAFGQALVTPVKGTLNDPSSTLWTNATVTATLYNPSGTQRPVFTKTGGLVPTTLLPIPITNSSGNFCFGDTSCVTNVGPNVPDNLQITPSGTRWIFSIQSNTSGKILTLAPILVTGVATQDITAQINAAIQAPSFTCSTICYGYKTSEVSTASIGAIFYNTSIGATTLCNQWNGNAWQSCSSGFVSNATAMIANLSSGVALTPATPYIAATKSGTVSQCYFVTQASDGVTALIFNVKFNGVNIINGTNATVAAGTVAKTISGFALTSANVNITQGQLWEVDVTQGTSNWIGVVECY